VLRRVHCLVGRPSWQPAQLGSPRISVTDAATAAFSSQRSRRSGSFSARMRPRHGAHEQDALMPPAVNCERSSLCSPIYIRRHGTKLDAREKTSEIGVGRFEVTRFALAAENRDDAG